MPSALRLLAGAACSVALVACGGGGGRQEGALHWKECGAGLECATLSVPLDYERPDGKTLDLALIRRRAGDPDNRIGSLVVNPGGPGGSGVDVVRQGISLLLPPAVAERFDLVGFDPRGVGGSGRIDCGVSVSDILALDSVPDDQRELGELAALDRRFSTGCATRHGDLLPFVGTVNAARDLDRIRDALGDEKLTYLGFSYGARLGSVYAHLFPKRIRALVLDGGVDPSKPSEQLARDSAGATALALSRFFDACRADSTCPIGPRPEAVWDEVRARLEAPGRTPIRGRITIAHLQTATVVLLSVGRQAWRVLADALDEARAGNGDALRTWSTISWTGGNSFATAVAVACADRRERTTAAGAVRLARELEAEFERPGIGQGLACADSWRAPADPIPNVRAMGAPAILVVGTTYDPATPYSWSVALAEALDSGVLLTYRGDGHTALAQSVPCVRAAVARYLVELAPPPPGAVCRAVG